MLQRRIGTARAVVVGLAAMLGAGVFFVWAPAAAVAGSALLIGLLIAAVVAMLNALSTAQLAMAHPVSGGAYAFARATIGPRTGFAAGIAFLIGKTASAGAIALIAANYLVPDAARPAAAIVVVILAAVNATGIRSTAAVATAVVVVVLVTLTLVAVIAIVRLPAVHVDGGSAGGVGGVLQSAGLIFFSFAGYARMATLGEEVINPRRTLPRAIVTSLAITLVIYGIIGTLCLVVLGPVALADSPSPLAALADGPGETLIRVVAAIACLGSLSGVLAGLSRTALAMARERDLPGGLSRVSTKTHAPVVAEITISAIAVLGVLLLDPLELVAFSSTAVLLYYAIAQLSALRQPSSERWLWRGVQIAGLAGCCLLVVTLPWQAGAGVAGVLLVAFAARAIAASTSPR